MKYEVKESKLVSGLWHAEAIDHDSEGKISVATFAGPNSEERAREYAEWMNTKGDSP